MKKWIIFLFLSGLLVIGCSKSPLEPNQDEQLASNREATTELPSSPKIISNSDWQNSFISLSSDSSTFTFDARVDTLYDFKVNDIMISTEGEGFLRRIIDIQRTRQHLVIKTEQAAITEVVEDGEARFETSFSQLDPPRIDYLLDGVYVNQGLQKGNAGGDITFDFDLLLGDFDGQSNTTNDQLRVAGHFEMSVNMKGELKIKYFQLKKFSLDQQVKQQMDLNVTIGYPIVNLNPELKVAELTYPPIWVNLAGVPVLLTPVIEFYIGTDFTVNAAVQLHVGEQFGYAIGARYEDSKWHSYSQLEKDCWARTPDLSGEVDVKAYVKPVFKLKVFSVVSPKLSGKLFGEILANPEANPWWKLYGGLQVLLGVDMQIWGKTLFDKNFELITFRQQITEASGPFPGL